MNTINTKTTLLILEPDPPNNFEIRNMTLRITKDRNNKCRI